MGDAFSVPFILSWHHVLVSPLWNEIFFVIRFVDPTETSKHPYNDFCFSLRVHSIERRWSEMKDRLEARSIKMLTYHAYSTTDSSKKMKLELPVEKTVVSTEETMPTSEYPGEELGVRTRRKVITITKRTYRSSEGTPTESRTTVARIMSGEGLHEGEWKIPNTLEMSEILRFKGNRIN